MHVSVVLVLAVAVQILVFGSYFYMDAVQTVAVSWKDVVRFGLHPLVLLYFALTPLPVWWSYRVVYQSVGKRFWVGALVQGLLLQIVYMVSSYFGSQHAPSTNQFVGLLLSLIAVCVSAL